MTSLITTKIADLPTTDSQIDQITCSPIDLKVQKSTSGIFSKLSDFFASIRDCCKRLAGKISDFKNSICEKISNIFFKKSEEVVETLDIDPNDIPNAVELTESDLPKIAEEGGMITTEVIVEESQEALACATQMESVEDAKETKETPACTVQMESIEDTEESQSLTLKVGIYLMVPLMLLSSILSSKTPVVPSGS